MVPVAAATLDSFERDRYAYMCNSDAAVPLGKGRLDSWETRREPVVSMLVGLGKLACRGGPMPPMMPI